MSNKISEVSFYNLTTLPIHKAAPKLIEKIYYSNQKLLVITPDNDLLKMLDDGLWAYSTKHFIPHGTDMDEFCDQQPILLTTKKTNLNHADIIMTVANVELENLTAKKILHMFDSNVKEQLDFARQKWKILQQHQDISLVYWLQKEDGSWENKN
jgi:DNA polymerase III subunit chi